MGCSPNDADCSSKESPTRKIEVGKFQILEVEVNQSQYEAIAGKNPSQFAGCLNCPADMVTWEEARTFCQAVGGRLPSEVEWEYAARGGTTTRYYCGDDPACLDSIAWYDANSSGKTHPIKLKKPNAFGLYDILGNVWEWTEDCWHETYQGAPTVSGVWLGGNCSFHPGRGGGWTHPAIEIRVSRRGRAETSVGYDFYGVRCAR